MRLVVSVAGLLVIAALLIGCAGSKATGKYADQDKPKPVDTDK